MDIFNAPNRETCAVRRERTNTPLQALVTLNDPQYIEAARHMAQMALQKDVTDAATIDFIARRVLARPLRAEESLVVNKSLADLLEHYRSHADAATKLLAVGESPRDKKIDPATHAAWILRQMVRWKHLPTATDVLSAATEAVNTACYRRAAAALNIECPPDDLPPMRLRVGWFDPRSIRASPEAAEIVGPRCGPYQD